MEGSADNDGAYADGKLTWSKELADGESITVSFKVKVDEEVSGETLKNESTVKVGDNEYTSNEVTTPTPPKKDVFTGTSETSIDGKVVKPGEELTYKITYTNTSGETVTAEITDTIPQHTTYVDGSADNDGAYADGKLTWSAEVENGKSITVSFKVTVDEEVSGETLRNEGKVKVGENEYTTNEVTNPTPPKKDVSPAEDPETSIDGKMVKPGQELIYKITYKNTSGETVTAEITDTIPQYTTYVEGSADNDGAYADGKLTWTKELADGDSITVSFKVKVDEAVSGETLKNESTVRVGDNEYTSNEVTTPTPPKKEVFTGETTTNIDGKMVEHGQELTYKITYKNTSGEKVTATITDTIPAHTTYVADSADNDGVYDETERKLTWTKELANEESITVSFKVTVDNDVKGEPLTNESTVLVGENEYKSNEVTNPTPPKKDVFTEEEPETSIDGKMVKPGDTLIYKIEYLNSTEEEMKVEITDKVPEFTTYVDGSADNGGTHADGVVTWSDLTVAAGESIAVTFKVTVDKEVTGETLRNEGKVKIGENEYNTNEVTNPTPPKKDVFSSKDAETSIDGKKVQPTQELTYTITYKNTSGEAVTATITDAIPPYTTYVADSADHEGKYEAAKAESTTGEGTEAEGGETTEAGAEKSKGTITWTVDLADGESVTVSFKVTVDTVSEEGLNLKNEAKVRIGENEYTSNEVTNEVELFGDLKIVKTLNTFAGPEIASFVFEIRWNDLQGNEQIRYAMLSFDSEGTHEYVLKREIPVGTQVTVEEVDTGMQYTFVESTQTATIVADQNASAPATVEFTNNHDNPGGGHGAVNRFTRGANDWTWNRLDESVTATTTTAEGE